MRASAVRAELARHGFRVRSEHRQFVLPIALHKAVGSRGVTRALEGALAEAVPFRRGHKGLHLVEAVALAARTSDAKARTELATTWFSEELAAMEKDLAAGGTLERYFVALGDPALEKRAVELLKPHLRLAETPQKKRSGLFGWFSRK